LAARSVTLTLNGNRGALSTSNTSCTGYSYTLSDFSTGVLLANACDPNVSFEVIFADYYFTVPAATRYNSIKVLSYGNTVYAPEPLAALIYNFSGAKWVTAGAVNLTTNHTNAWAPYGTVSGTGFV